MAEMFRKAGVGEENIKNFTEGMNPQKATKKQKAEPKTTELIDD